ncbi:DUF2975 domain-containing protein [Horticoccus sp. 23ND18S-11]|uniref:DUF2975 domain-containing protein n=1 Tax=Horticoccus sp. 23ND18S-11 TaxID=3391832 RepID=UPI0039C91A89
MKSYSALLVQIAVVLIGIGTLALMLWEPHLEGRNAHATIGEIYFHDPFLAFVYVGSAPFFLALHRTFSLFGHVRKTKAFSQVTVDALMFIKHCAIAIIGFVAVAAFLIIIFGDMEDRPAGIVMSVFVILASMFIAAGAAMLARSLQISLSRSDASEG